MSSPMQTSPRPQRLMRHDPGDPGWSNRDRFALSCRPWYGPAPRRPGRPARLAEDVRGRTRGGYVLAEADGGAPRVVLICAAGEADVALDARAILQRDGIAARVVAMPSLTRFRQQSPEYREQVLPARVRARVSVEAGSALGWYELLGEAGLQVGLDQYGSGAPCTTLHRQHGFTAERIAATARAALARAGHREHA
ncbi:hypothetical protein AB0953_01580 [Streptomyces sp. NPDC046866]|uniref:transketolase-like TK C-terminal-containing protein n=1 Tax=Streptomyces sp. NPDC046866 TaxID=3154921 RepID=UPI003451E462